MGIPVGKLSLYTALQGVRPSACLPVKIDVGTNNEELLKDEFYIGLRQRRATGQEYAELLHEFMSAVKQTYGEKVLIQFEDFANHNAFDLVAKYGLTDLVFNDDIQGTTSVVLSGLIAALKLVGGTLAEHTFLFLGAGEAGIGIAGLIALQMSKQTGAPVEETRKKIWKVDSKGLIIRSRMEALQHFKRPWAHDHEPVTTLVDAVKAIKPTVLIGSSGAGRTFTKEVVEAMASFNEVSQETLSLMRTVRVYGTEQQEFQRYKHWLAKVADISLKQSAAYGLWNFSFNTLYHSTQVAIIVSRLGRSFDPELEFDREVYPLGLLPNVGVVVGVSQRMSFSACTEFPCFQPPPEAQNYFTLSTLTSSSGQICIF